MRCIVPALAGSGLGLLAACTGPRGVSLALAPSVLPNLGLMAAAAVPIEAGSPHHLELRFTDQFVDDKLLADDGNPEAGNWTQLDLGWLLLPETPRGVSARLALTGFEARGEPNLVDESGDYWGLLAGVGWFAELAPGWWLGPELALVAATGPEPFVLFPQLTWGLRWRAAPQRCATPAQASGVAATR